MVRVVSLLSLAALAGAQYVPRPGKPAPIDIEKEYPKIPNEYIVVFHPEASDAEIHAHLQNLEGTDGTIKFKYNNTKQFRGYSMRVVDEEAGSAITYAKARVADAYAAGSEVKYIEQNGVVKAFGPKSVPTSGCNTQEQTTWGLVRVGQVQKNIDGLFSYVNLPDTDHDAKAYVLDTGIYRENVEFLSADGTEVRAKFGADFTTKRPPIMTDLNGHGTHCAGTVMGNLHGMVKDGVAVDVRVLDANGSGSYDGVIAGIDYVAGDGAGQRAVGSMSLGGGKSTAINDAIGAAVDAGVTMIVAAGNDARDACSYSPASAEKAITVACSDVNDEMCYFSNYGACTDIIAPGAAITSAWIGSAYSENTISGTSMSTPHVAGAALRIVAHADYVMTPTEVKAVLMSTATKDVITQVYSPSTTPNRLLTQVCTDFTSNSSKAVFV